ncbi:MAG: hypothetical protein RDU24_09760 [Humidesulfovibrio sp.]|uniref:hypothetical protein n=1 Tax=Humidesulfovibrio sp. TaxID=2910988 RepID=UPI0027F534BF|nr:hypothetical protein [Humidesulfovibrio sp.]MDQ7835654.1 hypothetical protein [Humidesulfovibrio sp.]
MTSAGDRFLARLPLLAVYVLMPLAVLAGRVAERPEFSQRFGPQGLTPWLVLAGLALVVSLGRDIHARRPLSRASWLGLGLAVLMAVAVHLGLRLFGPVLSQAQDLAPLLDELRLPALVLFAAAWTFCFGAPRRETLVHLGGALGALLALDFLVTAIMARQVVLGGGFLLGGGQAASDTMAFLLLIALCATLDLPEAHSPEAAGANLSGLPVSTGSAVSATSPWGLSRWLVLAGLFVTFSRPGLLAAGGVVLLLERGPLQERLALACACILGIWMSMALPLASTLGGGEDLGLSWYLTAVVEALKQEPGAWLVGLPLNEPVALAMPDVGGLDWAPEAAGLPVSAFDIPSSWLRLLAGWGLGGPLLAAAGMLACALHGRRRFGFGLLLATLLAAALTPALHTPASAGALALAFACAWRSPPEPAPTPVPGAARADG